MKLEVGMYVRTNKVGIKKIYKIDNNKTKYKYLYKLKNQDGDGCIDLGVLCEDDIIKFSYIIIDILEKGDYVNGYKVSLKGYDYAHFVQCDYPVENGTTNHYKFYEQAIKSVVTKKQFENMTYNVGE